MSSPALALPGTGVPAVARRAPVNKWLVTISISFGTLMGAIDSSIVSVALPHIRGSVGATLQEITAISTGYAVALVLVMPLTAFLSRQFGQKNVYMACLVLFLLGSLLCGFATSLTSLVIYRVIQGFGAGQQRRQGTGEVGERLARRELGFEAEDLPHRGGVQASTEGEEVELVRREVRQPEPLGKAADRTGGGPRHG